MNETERIIDRYMATEGPRVRAPFPGESTESWLQRKKAYVEKLGAVMKKLNITMTSAIPENTVVTFNDGDFDMQRTTKVYHVSPKEK